MRLLFVKHHRRVPLDDDLFGLKGTFMVCIGVIHKRSHRLLGAGKKTDDKHKEI